MTPTAAGLHLHNPGLSATIQDIGRRGYRHQGLAVSGALDLHAYHWANKLLDNAPDAPCLEVIGGGLKATALSPLSIAITGAEAPISINGEQVQHWATLDLRKDDELVIGHPTSGRIIYLALTGGIQAPSFFASHSVAPREKIDGLGLLQQGSVLTAEVEQASPVRRVPERFKPNYSEELELGILPGYQLDQFSRSDLRKLTTTPYELSQQSDRMGYRLSGAPLESPPPGIISEGIAIGAVQIPGDGQPIVLMNDCQTIGGYPKPGTLARLDCSKLSQRLPGQTVRFQFADLADVQNERRLFERFFTQTEWYGDALEWI